MIFKGLIGSIMRFFHRIIDQEAERVNEFNSAHLIHAR